MQLIETHISWVLLAGDYAYKIKKAVHPGFLDFSTLDKRLHFCTEEIRLNKRLAPEIYLDVIPIGGSAADPVIGELPAIEYAVRMNRFPSERTLDLLAEAGKLDPCHIDRLAEKIASFHEGLAPASSDSGYGKGLLEVATVSFAELRKFLDDDLSALEQSVEEEHSKCAVFFRERLENGFVRECHGDLHLGNVALLDEEPVPFDCIEFDAKLRWIDVMNEIAFPVMDLLFHERLDLACRFLNTYLEIIGDYGGMKVFRFYLACRAVVRAMVDAMRGKIPSARSHLALASSILAPPRPFLIVTHGLPGSGKTTFSQEALERLGAIRLRSDLERKRLAGLEPLAKSGSGIDSGIYSAASSESVYSRLLDLARELLASGFPVLVDAAFLESGPRHRFRELARDFSVPFCIASLHASRETLESRILSRRNDASEANLAVLRAKEASREPLGPDEGNYAVTLADVRGEKDWENLERITGKREPPSPPC